MITIHGKRLKGLGHASHNLAIQLPLIIQEFPEIADCRPGTINVQFERPLLVLTPDHRTRPIPWKQGPEFGEGEIFEFLRIQVELPTGAVRAWLYLSHITPHRADPRVHEIVAPELNLETEQEISIHIARPAFQLPYLQFPAVVVL